MTKTKMANIIHKVMGRSLRNYRSAVTRTANRTRKGGLYTNHNLDAHAAADLYHQTRWSVRMALASGLYQEDN